MAQAKAQVAAKSEKEAMQYQQLELQVVESFEDNASATQNNESKHPMVWHHKLPPNNDHQKDQPRIPWTVVCHPICIPPI